MTSAVPVCTESGCATTGNHNDPVESFNCSMFSVNETLDQAVVKPVARGYEIAVPKPVRNGVSSFTGTSLTSESLPMKPCRERCLTRSMTLPA